MTDTVDANITLGMEGYFKLRKGIAHPDGSETITGETPWFHNLITNAGLDMIGAGESTTNNEAAGDILAAVQVGTGSAPPAVGDSTLSNRLTGTVTNAPSGSGSGMVVGPPRYGWRRIARRFSQGAAAGNLTEVGISRQVNSPLFSRELIRDGQGQPTVLTVLPTEFLDVIYELRLYPPDADVVVQGTIEGVPYEITIRPLSFSRTATWHEYIPNPRVTSTSGANFTISATNLALPALGENANRPTPNIAGSADAYVSGQLRRAAAAVFGINSANFNIQYVTLSTGIGEFGFGFSPPIPKDNTKELRIKLGVSWARYAP